MIKNTLRFLPLLMLLFASCDTSGVKKADGGKTDTSSSLLGKKGDGSDKKNPNSDQVQDERKLLGGITVKWFEHGSGEKLKNGDMLKIDYEVRLKNGDVIDGNHLLNKPHMLFMLGFGMQTSGWDIALKEMKVGDRAEIYLPAAFARGEQEVKGLFPPNSDNYITIRIVERAKPSRVIDGNKVWLFEENTKNKELFDEGKEIEFHTMAFTPSSSLYLNTFRDNQPFKMKLEDYGLVPGLKKSLINAKKADRMWVYVPSSEAYGSKGYHDLVKPNEAILYNIYVMDVSTVAQ